MHAVSTAAVCTIHVRMYILQYSAYVYIRVLSIYLWPEQSDAELGEMRTFLWVCVCASVFLVSASKRPPATMAAQPLSVPLVQRHAPIDACVLMVQRAFHTYDPPSGLIWRKDRSSKKRPKYALAIIQWMCQSRSMGLLCQLSLRIHVSSVTRYPAERCYGQAAVRGAHNSHQ